MTSKFYSIFFSSLLYHFFYLNIYLLFFISADENNELINNVFEIEKDFRYLTFASYSNGDMILASTAFPKTTKRIFYGFKNNGRPFFNDGTSYYFSKNVNLSKDTEEKFECEAIIIKLSGNNNDGKEYLLSIGNKESYAEIYDFEEDKVYKESMNDFTGKNIRSFRNTAISLFSENNDYYYLFAFSILVSQTSKFTIQIHKFDSLSNSGFSNTKIDINYEINSHYEREGFSCFQTKSLKIVCFILNNNKEYRIILFSSYINLTSPTNLFIYKNTHLQGEEYPFYKCIHLKEEIGIFIYYTFYNIQSNTYYYNPNIIFKKIENSSIKAYSISDIILSKYTFNTNLLANDLIKLSEKKICFSSIENDLKKAYIILINIFREETKYRVRYFSLNLYSIKKLYFHGDIRLHNYNNFLAFAHSYCTKINSHKSDPDFDDHYSALMIFSYSNSTDSSIDLLQYLLDNYNSTIKDISINLEKYVKIENNIFGYIFFGIIINKLIKCDSLSLLSSSSNEIILANYTLKKDEEIKLEFINNNYNCFDCNLEYRYIITEPNLTEYDSLSELKEGDTEEITDFNKELYFGKLTYFNIILSKNLTENCEDINCYLCLKEINTFCIICRYNFTYNSSSHKKECLENTYDNIEESNKEEEQKEKQEKEETVENLDNNNETINIKIEEPSDFDNRIINLITNKEQLKKELPKIINYIEIGQNYEINGEDFSMIIKPTNSSIIPSSTHVDFSKCENILRKHYNIDSSRILTFFQVEIKNKNEKSLVNQVEYQVYDDEKKLLNLSVCDKTNIEVFYSIKSNSSINLDSLNSFKDLDIDLLNIKDRFFTDICIPYSYLENDIVLLDRIIDFYQNYSLCDNNCMYNEIDLELKVISCNCSVKTNLNTEEANFKLEQLKDVEKSMAFEIIKCYNLAFSWKNKLKNIGFWIFLFFVFLHIPLLIIYFNKGIKPIKNYIINEMADNGYIKKGENILSNEQDDVYNNKKCEKRRLSKRKSITKRKNILKRNSLRRKPKTSRVKNFNLSKEESKLKSPPKKTEKKNTKIKPDKLKLLEEINIVSNSSSLINKMKSEREIINNLNNNSKANNIKNKTKEKILSKRKEKRAKTQNLTIKKKESLALISTQGNSYKQSKKEKNHDKKENDKIINFNLININLNSKRKSKYIPSSSNYILNIYTFKEAIENDLRSLCLIFYIYLLTKQIFFHAFLFKSPLVLFPLRFCLLIFIISSDFALNALFYFDDKISEKYRYAKNIFLFALSKNITIILLSTFIGFILLTLFTKLSNSTNAIRDIFRKEEEKMKHNKKYIVNEQRKKEIQKEIGKILNNYKIKVYIFIIIEILLMLFYWYYVTIFCHVYNNTQKSWILDSFLAMLSRIIIDFLLCLGFAKLYRIAVESNVHALYKISLFFYSFC